VKSAPFEFRAPDSLEQVLALLAEYGDEAKLIAGGQSLMPMLAMRLARPSVLIDIGRVAGLNGIEAGDGHLSIGATTTERQAERSPLVAGRVPVLAQALPFIGHVSIRNRGTVGGSLAHADASAELPAVAVATDAEMVLRGPGGERTVPADDFFVGHFTTSIADDECLVEVRLPASPPDAGWAFYEIARRSGDFALVGVAAMLQARAGRIEAARICLMGVSDRPRRARSVEDGLTGQSMSPETFAAAAADAVRDLDPASDMHGSAAHRRHLAGVAVRRALAAAAPSTEGVA
jgi:carbon-monoxide dehydrogenase medium subunit